MNLFEQTKSPPIGGDSKFWKLKLMTAYLRSLIRLRRLGCSRIALMILVAGHSNLKVESGSLGRYVKMSRSMIRVVRAFQPGEEF